MRGIILLVFPVSSPSKRRSEPEIDVYRAWPCQARSRSDLSMIWYPPNVFAGRENIGEKYELCKCCRYKKHGTVSIVGTYMVLYSRSTAAYHFLALCSTLRASLPVPMVWLVDPPEHRPVFFHGIAMRAVNLCV